MKKIKMSTKEWKIQANFVHSNKYIYSKSRYINTSTKLIVTCPIHGDFRQSASEHLRGRGCPLCAKENNLCRIKDSSKGIENFILEANKIHNNLYNYEKSIYKNRNTKLIIICKIHGEFEQTPSSHLKGCGCPKCKLSKGELLISNWLFENNIPFIPQHKISYFYNLGYNGIMLVDFYIKINDIRYIIEYDGRQHFYYTPRFHTNGILDFEKQQTRDNILLEYCNLPMVNISLIRFKYTQNKEFIFKELDRIFNNNPL